MGRFEHSKGSGDRYSRRRRDSNGFDRGFGRDRPRRDSNRFDRGFGRDSGRSRPRKDFNRRDVQMTKVICSSCNEQCEVPFKPTSSKPIYCKSCFGNNGGSTKPSERDIDVINEKLNKIMKALNIE